MTSDADPNQRIVYTLNVEDIQTVAEAQLGRSLTQSEIEVVEKYLPEYVNWFDAISNATCFDLKAKLQAFS